MRFVNALLEESPIGEFLNVSELFERSSLRGPLARLKSVSPARNWINYIREIANFLNNENSDRDNWTFIIVFVSPRHNNERSR